MINKILLILLVIACLVFIVNLNKKEFYRDFIPTKNRVLYNIIPTFDNQYLATFVPKNNESTDNIVITYSLESNEWRGPINNASPDTDTYIIDLTYGKDKRLIGVGMTYDKVKNLPVYKIYIKQTEDVRSKWLNIESNENIRSVTYDINGKTIIGCRDDGQLFIKKNDDLYDEWIGPINYDKPMKKVQFDKDGKLIGIGLKDNLIYKKKEYDWRKSKWNRQHKGFDKVYDIFHDYDGSLIATSPNGILKQEHSNFMSDFKPLNETEKKDTILSIAKILQYRTGLELLKDDIEKDKLVYDPKLSNKLNEILLFKSKAKDLCKNKNKDMKSFNDTNLLETNNQLKEIEKIENLINILT